jgi:hypothetical protein
MRIALQKEFGCRAPPRTAATGRQTKSKLASEFGEADFAFYYHIKIHINIIIFGRSTSSSNHEAIQYFTPGHGGPLRKSERI